MNTWPEADLGRIFREWGEERAWRRIAAKVVAVRLLPSLQLIWAEQECLRTGVGARLMACQPVFQGVCAQGARPTWGASSRSGARSALGGALLPRQSRCVNAAIA